jgi:hypothetical protein
MQPTRSLKITLLCCAALLAVGLTFSQSQTPKRKWTPTRVPANTHFVGTQACAECHAGKVKSHAQTLMGRALETVEASDILTKHPKLTFRTGPYLYEIVRKGNQSIFTVTDGKETISLPILYAFGLGYAGQTYVLQGQDGFYESRVSFYNDTQGLDYTIGVPLSPPVSLTDAIGRLMSKDETLQCFSCHTTGAVKGGKLEQEGLVPGIGCEACHGPGEEHIALGQKGEPNAHKIFNPGKLSGDDLTQEFCASCHRSVEDVTALPRLGGINNVRFQPYRIFNSKCYSDDRRISCIGCHNVHEPLKEEAAFYDAKCNACHTSQQAEAPIRLCKVATKNCTSCHMPKIELPGAHFKFTDHRIRVVKPGEPYPF